MINYDPITSTSPPAPAPENRPRRRWVVRTLVGLVILIGVVAAGLYVGARILAYRLADALIEEAEIDPDVVPELQQIGQSGLTPVGQPGVPGASASADGQITTFLVIGSDSREDLPEGFVNDRVGGQRADVIMLIRLEGDQVRVLSIPRDLGVEIEGYGFHKINAAFALGGSALMVKTITQEFDIPINHYLEVDFFGFASIVDALGGVDVSFPYQARDIKAHLNVPAGTKELDGEMALAYARSRNYQELRDGVWVSVDGSDFGRIRRQQTLLFAMLNSIKRPSILFEAEDLVRTAARTLTLDATFSRNQILDLANTARSINSSEVEVYTLPTTAFTSNGVYYLKSQEPDATQTWGDFLGASPAGEESAVAKPAELEPAAVRVLNGNGSGGQAAVWGEFLEERGFDLVGVGDAASFEFDETVVRVRPDDLGIGQQVVSMLGFGVVEFNTVGEGVDAVVIVGADALSQG